MESINLTKTKTYPKNQKDVCFVKIDSKTQRKALLDQLKMTKELSKRTLCKTIHNNLTKRTPKNLFQKTSSHKPKDALTKTKSDHQHILVELLL